MKKIASALFLIALCSSAMAQEWIRVSTSDETDYDILAGSLNVIMNKSGEEVAVVTGKERNKKTKNIVLEKVYVRTDHCLKKQGKGVVLDLDGNYKYEYDFIFGAGSVGTTIAETICGAYQKRMEEANKKGI